MKKRVLVIDEDQERNGSTVSLEYLVRGFRDRGYDVVVLTWKYRAPDAAGLKRSATLIDGRIGFVTTITLCVHFAYSMSPFSWQGIRLITKDAVKFVLGFLIVRRVLRKIRPDIVYANEYSVVQACVAARTAGIPAVTHVRSPLLKGKFGLRRRLISRLVLGNTKRVFAITRQEADQLRPSPAERSNIRVVGEFVPRPAARRVDPKKLRRGFGLPPAGKVVSMLGGIKPYKGTMEFLRAARIVCEHHSNIRFVIAGSDLRDGSEQNRAYYEECMRAVRDLRSKGAVTMVGEITNPLDLVAASDIVVSPSPQAHFSRPVIEAWSFAKPVIAARTPHMEECITDGVNGLLFEPGDQSGLAGCISRLSRDSRLRARLGREGKKKASAEFDAERNCDTIVHACDELIRHK